MKRPVNGSTPRQTAYAMRKLGGQGKSKKEMALASGFSTSVAENVYSKIETTEGFHNAMKTLAIESGNIVLAVMSKYKARGLKNFSNKDLNGAMNAISSAWEKFNKMRAPNGTRNPDENPLKKIVMQRIENQTINNNMPASKETPPAPVEIIEEGPGIDLDF